MVWRESDGGTSGGSADARREAADQFSSNVRNNTLPRASPTLQLLPVALLRREYAPEKGGSSWEDR